MPRVRTLTERQLLMTYLGRQLLVERQPMTVTRAIGRLVALQAQYSPAPFIALHSRLDGFTTDALDDALERGRVVKSTLMRGTLHLVDALDYPYYAAAWQVQAATNLRARAREAAPSEDDIVESLRGFLAEPRTTDDIRAFVADRAGDLVPSHVRLDYARLLLPLVHVPPSGTWGKHGKFSLRLWDATLADPHVGTVRLVKRYLAGYGPASREDIAAFTYLRYRELDPALAELGVRTLIGPDGVELLDIRDGRLVDESVRPPTRFLAQWDHAIVGLRDRSRILPTQHYDKVFGSANGLVPTTFLVDGQVSGQWRTDLIDRTAVLTLLPFDASHNLPPDLEPEAHRMLRFVLPDADQYEIEVQPA